MIMKKVTKKELPVIVMTMALTGSLLTGCGASGSKTANGSASYAPQENGSAYDAVYAEAAAAEEMAAVTAAGIQESRTQNIDSMTLLEEKLVYHCSLDIETLDYSGTITAIKDTIRKYDGVIQSENESDSGYNWYYENYRKTGGTMHNYLEIRIPSADYDSFLSELDGVGKIISKSTNVDNISQQYYDTTTRIEALQIQEKNLLGMMEQCETIEDMLTVEERLIQVQYELNNLQTTKRYMDVDVAYSYVDINISEVMEYRQESEPAKRNTFADRLGNTVKSTGRGFLLFLEAILFLIIRLSPYIILAGAICFVFLRKKIRRFIADRKEKEAANRAQKELRRQAVIQQAAQMNPQQENGGKRE